MINLHATSPKEYPQVASYGIEGVLSVALAILGGLGMAGLLSFSTGGSIVMLVLGGFGLAGLALTVCCAARKEKPRPPQEKPFFPPLRPNLLKRLLTPDEWKSFLEAGPDQQKTLETILKGKLDKLFTPDDKHALVEELNKFPREERQRILLERLAEKIEAQNSESSSALPQ